VIVKEFPMNTGDPYYPIDIDNPYSLITEPNVIFGGRLAEYKYYNMDQIIEKALYDYSTRG
jgi:UDP-galactopyranose mutase